MKNNNQEVELFDIHTHILPNVDDGSPSLFDSLNMLEEEVKSGVKSIILTPHYHHRMFEEKNEKIIESFNDFVKQANNENINVNLYLGREIYVSSSTDGLERIIKKVEDGTVKGLNNSKYYLFEFSYTQEIEISEVAYTFVSRGLKPIIAHIERYNYIDSLDKIYEIKQTGALIQVNASSVLGLDGAKVKKFVWKLLKNDLVDFVASDIHSDRVNYLLKSYELINKKLGSDFAKKLFLDNPTKIIKE